MGELSVVKGCPRVQFGFADMSGVTTRMFGSNGVSFIADDLAVTACASKADRFELHVSGAISIRTKNTVARAFESARKRGLNTRSKIMLKSNIPEHIGLGSCTKIVLSSLDAVSSLFHWDLNPNEMIELSGRGRACQIGAATHYYGGYCIDAGQPKNDNLLFVPSHWPEGRDPALFVGSWEFPQEWLVTILGAELPPTVSPETERNYLANNTPTDKLDGLKTMALLYGGILPSIIENNYCRFEKAINEFNSVGYKKNIHAIQPIPIQNAISDLRASNLAAAVSSFGPALFCIHRAGDYEIISAVAKKNNLGRNGPYPVYPKVKR